MVHIAPRPASRRHLGLPWSASRRDSIWRSDPTGPTSPNHGILLLKPRQRVRRLRPNSTTTYTLVIWLLTMTTSEPLVDLRAWYIAPCLSSSDETSNISPPWSSRHLSAHRPWSRTNTPGASRPNVSVSIGTTPAPAWASHQPPEELPACLGVRIPKSPSGWSIQTPAVDTAGARQGKRRARFAGQSRLGCGMQRAHREHGHVYDGQSALLMCAHFRDSAHI